MLFGRGSSLSSSMSLGPGTTGVGSGVAVASDDIAVAV